MSKGKGYFRQGDFFGRHRDVPALENRGLLTQRTDLHEISGEDPEKHGHTIFFSSPDGKTWMPFDRDVNGRILTKATQPDKGVDIYEDESGNLPPYHTEIEW